MVFIFNRLLRPAPYVFKLSMRYLRLFRSKGFSKWRWYNLISIIIIWDFIWIYLNILNWFINIRLIYHLTGLKMNVFWMKNLLLFVMLFIFFLGVGFRKQLFDVFNFNFWVILLVHLWFFMVTYTYVAGIWFGVNIYWFRFVMLGLYYFFLWTIKKIDLLDCWI